ncbi:hypothetical protein A2368_01540 [Candidatus Collierbacteria bacterium RIFOXYB1_FULL_49_13]|uniref:Uncharacterized protein n=1 Tax=Candidatus Collierbacteria bacterium RIFOXYB1_FULL_49_13 TaxID=1817728 RepID=A0A1F5FGT8_9BACT|nr:MAG: hypothetical protein A2368_01540 [Candidatus Collierbacteria bacterium RIFOXYB1_FULL_49_13]
MHNDSDIAITCEACRLKRIETDPDVYEIIMLNNIMVELKCGIEEALEADNYRTEGILALRDYTMRLEKEQDALKAGFQDHNEFMRSLE